MPIEDQTCDGPDVKTSRARRESSAKAKKRIVRSVDPPKFSEQRVQCGLGRTGYHWAHEDYSVFPDIMTLAKPLAGGLPIGAVLVTERVAAAINYGDHGSTFAGAPLVCSAAIAVLDKISEPSFLASVSKKGQYFKELLSQKLGGNSEQELDRAAEILLECLPVLD